MDQRFKQRLIGAVVLVALAVIFLPMLLSGPAERTRVDIELDIPQEPPAPETPALPDAAMLDEPEPGESLESQPAPVEPQALPEAAAPTESALTDGFFVQVGAFGSEANAQRLAERLQDDDHAVVIRNETVGEQTRHIVQVGPKASRGDAEQLAQQLANEHELSGFIVEPATAD